MEREMMEAELETLDREYRRLRLSLDELTEWEAMELQQLRESINWLRMVLGYKIDVLRAIAGDGHA
jgi:hypothetical protein